MSIEVEAGGVLTTIQDSGRIGYRSLGVNPNGWMDTFSARIAQFLVGNDVETAVLEFHFPAPMIRFEIGSTVSLTGADFCPFINDKPVAMWKAFSVKPGDLLSFKRPFWGSRAYLAIQNGLSLPLCLSSRSTNLKARFGGFKGRGLQKGDRIDFVKNKPKIISELGTVSPHFRFQYLQKNSKIRILRGPEFGLLEEAGERTLKKGVFRISGSSDRMGFRLNGPQIDAPTGSMVSSGVTFGTVQLLPDGNLIILMADHQTTGGYPRIATVIAADLPRLAQKSAGQNIEFELTTIEEAEDELLKLEQDLRYLKTALNLGRIVGRMTK